MPQPTNRSVSARKRYFGEIGREIEHSDDSALFSSKASAVSAAARQRAIRERESEATAREHHGKLLAAFSRGLDEVDASALTEYAAKQLAANHVMLKGMLRPGIRSVNSKEKQTQIAALERTLAEDRELSSRQISALREEV